VGLSLNHRSRRPTSSTAISATFRKVTIYIKRFCVELSRASLRPHNHKKRQVGRIVTIEGESREFTIKGDSGRTLTRRFCPTFASVICLNTESHPGETLLMGGTLDDSKSLKPTVMLFCNSAQPWVLSMGHEMTRFPGMPPE
jgi:hypothetical protein